MAMTPYDTRTAPRLRGRRRTPARDPRGRGAQPGAVGSQRSGCGPGSAAWRQAVPPRRPRHRADRGRDPVPRGGPRRAGPGRSGGAGAFGAGRPEAGPGHPWSTAGRLEPGRLAESEWVLREPGSGTRSAFEAALDRFGLSRAALRVTLELPSNEAVRSAVEAGMGATALSASVASPSLEAGLLHRVQLTLPERDFLVLRHAGRYRTRAGNALLEIMSARPAQALAR